MERPALRLATVAALLNGGVAPWPTLAGEFVYDSITDDLVDVVPKQRRPVIVVRTDDDVIGFTGTTPMSRQIRLLIEFGVLTAMTVKVGDQELAKVDWPRTDSALEAQLDLLEWHIFSALFGKGEWASWWQNCAKSSSALAYSSTPRFTAPERGSVRLAVRTLQMLVAVPFDCAPPLVPEFGPQQRPFIPKHWGNVVGYILDHGGGDFRIAVEQMLRSIMRYGPLPVPTAPPLQRVWGSFPGFEIETDWRIPQEAPLATTGIVAEPPVLDHPEATSG